jgi:basic membrane protein A
MHRNIVFIAILTAVLLGGVGCSTQKETLSTVDGGKAAPKILRAAIVTDAGGIDDQSFNASAWAGLQRAQAEGGIEAHFIESKEQSDYIINLSTMAEQGYDLVFAVGFLMEDALKAVAPRFPRTKFAIIDGSAPHLPNCVSLKFREEEGSFLAGYLAGKMTKTGALGFVGGMEVPIIKKFECGYIAGARTARPDIRVIIKYVGNWTDVAKGKELAHDAIGKGADILFAAAGKGGLGALAAISEKGPGYYGIGVDADQDHIHKGRILTSMMKGVDTAVYTTTRELKAGRWKSGEHVFGVKEGGVHLSPMKYTKQDVPPEVLTKLEEISQAIAEGRIKVPSTPEELQNFVPPQI